MKSLIILILLLLPSSLLAEQLILGGSKNFSLLPIIAEQQGFYKEAGVSVRHEIISVGKTAMDAALAGTVDVGVIVDTNLSFVSFRDNDLKVIATILRHSTDGLVECSPELELNANEIRGKRVGYFPATTSHIFLVRWLINVGLTMKDIHPVILQPTVMTQAIKTKAVDVVSIWNPWRVKLIAQIGTDCKESISSSALYPSYAYLAVRTSTLKNRERALRKFLHALLKADEFVSKNKQQAITAYENFTNMDTESTASVWNYSEPRLELSNLSSKVIGETINWLSVNEPRFRGKKIFNHKNFFAPEILESIAPERVTFKK